jgi:rod shape-determining protein MreB
MSQTSQNVAVPQSILTNAWCFCDAGQGMFSSDLSVDLGSTSTLIYARGRGIVLNEPSVVAIRQFPSGGNAVAAIGDGTRQMLGRTPQNIKAIRPLKHGVISDLPVTQKMLQYFIAKVQKGAILRRRPRVLVCVPCCLGPVERRAVKESVVGVGVREVYLLEEPLAAAIGAGLPVDEPRGSMVVDIGGGTSQVAVMSLNGIVYSRSVRVGGDRFDDAIVGYVRRAYGTLIGESTAERVRHEIGSAFPSKEIHEIDVTGQRLADGMPRRVALNSREILQVLQEPLSHLSGAVRTALDQIPPELGADIAARGIVLSGGGALLRGTDRWLAEETGLPVQVAREPITCVARGSGKALEMVDDWDRGLFARE